MDQSDLSWGYFQCGQLLALSVLGSLNHFGGVCVRVRACVCLCLCVCGEMARVSEKYYPMNCPFSSDTDSGTINNIYSITPIRFPLNSFTVPGKTFRANMIWGLSAESLSPQSSFTQLSQIHIGQ